MKIVILSSTSALDLDPAMTRTCSVSESSFYIGLIRNVQLLKGYMQSGRKPMPEISMISVWLICFIQDLCFRSRRYEY